MEDVFRNGIRCPILPRHRERQVGSSVRNIVSDVGEFAESASPREFRKRGSGQSVNKPDPHNSGWIRSHAADGLKESAGIPPRQGRRHRRLVRRAHLSSGRPGRIEP